MTAGVDERDGEGDDAEDNDGAYGKGVDCSWFGIGHGTSRAAAGWFVGASVCGLTCVWFDARLG